ncbi:MAG: EAL domain-containing protein [Eubacterium sp.]|nr:EAL domain-containing protein [Eubacterium sp.]
MLKSHVKFHSTAGKRLVLIVDDEQVNRELLGFIVSSDFDVLYAASGEEAMQVLKENARHISLVLLDLMMPGMDGFDVMRIMRNDPAYEGIPILVLTNEEKAEVESLRLGASDFIIKPFRNPEVIIARMQKAIELFEDRHIIESTEREPLTGLFIKNFFYRYAEQYDQYHTDTQMDAIALDISHFHLINEMYGRDAGDGVLKHLGAFLKSVIERVNGMACRLEADKFLMYLPADSESYEDMFVKINEHFNSYSDINVRVRGGIYKNVDKSLGIERRFDRATQAANQIKNDFTKSFSYYDITKHEREIYAERLINEFDAAIENHQFQIYYQPKYNVQGEEPVLASAEALVRWKHPDLGMVSPGMFIPLFEKNGLIQKLDYYIWARAAENVRVWKETIGRSVPVSVNVSRVDLYHHDLVTYLQKILAENSLSTQEMYLEITESAYTENADQIVYVIDLLRKKGFQIEMDDFGTGYSSLNMLADIPVDILKLDMKFVQNLRTNQKQETLVRLIMDIARYLNMRVVAEGVEEKSQVDFLRSVGCHVIQGYYFSKPLPEEEFAQLLKEL